MITTCFAAAYIFSLLRDAFHVGVDERRVIFGNAPAVRNESGSPLHEATKWVIGALLVDVIYRDRRRRGPEAFHSSRASGRGAYTPPPHPSGSMFSEPSGYALILLPTAFSQNETAYYILAVFAFCFFMAFIFFLYQRTLVFTEVGTESEVV